MNADLKLWTVEEANGALPKVATLVGELRDAVEAHRFALEQVADLRRLNGAKAVEEPGHPDHAEYVRHVSAAEDANARVRHAVRAFQELGAEVKDPFIGLVDFPAMRGKEVVYLCWQHGEHEVTHWHSLTGGYPTRQPVDELVLAGGR